MSDWQHIEIHNHGTIVVLRPISDEGRDWLSENVGEPEPGGIYTCEPRMAQDILQAAARDLLSMQ
jgi:virulence-associated protein VagC